MGVPRRISPNNCGRDQNITVGDLGEQFSLERILTESFQYSCGDRRFGYRYRGKGRTQFFQQHGEIAEREPGAAVLFGNSEGRPAEFNNIPPEVRSDFSITVCDRAYGSRAGAVGQKFACRSANKFLGLCESEVQPIPSARYRRGARGRFSPRCAMMFFWISLVPARMGPDVANRRILRKLP